MTLPESWMKQVQAVPTVMEEILFIKNDGVPGKDGAPSKDRACTWQAGGRTVHLEPGDTQPLPRWVFHLGQNYPGHEKLRELHPQEGSAEFEQAEVRKLNAELKVEEEKLEKRRLELQVKRDALGKIHVDPPPPPPFVPPVVPPPGPPVKETKMTTKEILK